MPSPSSETGPDALNKIIFVWLALLAFTLPISIAASSLAFFPLAGLYFLGPVWTFRRWPPHWEKVESAFALFWGLSALSALLGVSFENSLVKLGKDLYFLLMILLTALLCRRAEARSRLLKIFLSGGCVTAAWAILQYLVGINRTLPTGLTLLNVPPALAHWPQPILERLALFDGRATGLRSHPLRFADELLFPLAFLLSFLAVSGKRSWWKWGSAAGTLLAALILTQSRGPWIAFAVMALAVPFFESRGNVWRRLALLVALPAVLFLSVPALRTRVFTITDFRFHSNNERLIMWKAGVHMIKDHPFLGVGPGNVKRVSGAYQTAEQKATMGDWGHLHNTYINIAAERGLLGLGAFLLFIGTLAWTLLKSLRNADAGGPDRRAILLTALLSLIGWLVCGFTETAYNSTSLMMIFYFVMGIALGYSRSCKE